MVAGQRRQHRRGVVGLLGFAEDAPAQADRGVGGQDRGVGQRAAFAAAQCGLGLQRADPLHIVVRRLAGQHRFERLRVFVVVGQQQLVGHAELRQQFAAAGALGGEVEDVVEHGGTGAAGALRDKGGTTGWNAG